MNGTMLVRCVLAIKRAAPEPDSKTHRPGVLTVRGNPYLARDDGRCEAVVRHGKGIRVAGKDLKGLPSVSGVNVIHEILPLPFWTERREREESEGLPLPVT